MTNCRPAPIQQRRHDRHMSLDMSSCRRDRGGSYLVSCWNSGLCVPHGFTIIPHFISAVLQFFPAFLVRQHIHCGCSTYGSCGHASHEDIGCHKLQRKQHANLPDDVYDHELGLCAVDAICILSQSPVKTSSDAPLAPILYLGRRNVSRVPAAGCGRKNLNLGLKLWYAPNYVLQFGRPPVHCTRTIIFTFCCCAPVVDVITNVQSFLKPLFFSQ